MLAPPLRTRDLPGSGGELRARVEDFVVEELLGFEPDGVEGRHLLLRLRKSGVNTKDAIARVARHCRLPAVEFGVAGLKDRHAKTTQWISAPAHARAALTDFSDASIELDPPLAHSAKLRRGQAAANRFAITVRGPHDDWESRLRAKLAALGSLVPNYYGPQRFGHEGKNIERGLQRILRPARRGAGDFFINAAQSAIFNLYLSDREPSGWGVRAMVGDLLADSQGGLARCEAESDASELRGRGLRITGPMVGGSVERPPLDTPAGRFEADILSRCGVGESHFAAWGKKLRGARRDINAKFELHALRPATAVASLPAGYTVEFTLPTGAYATSLLREFMEGEARSPEQK